MSDLEFSKPQPLQLIRIKAMDILARREHSRKELFTKLSSHFPDYIDLLDDVLDQLKEDHLQSDQRFAEAFVRSRVNRGQGPQRLTAELQQRGVCSWIIEEALGSADVDWYQIAVQVLAKKYRSPCKDFAERAKRSRFLQYRGFTPEQIRSVLE